MSEHFEWRESAQRDRPEIGSLDCFWRRKFLVRTFYQSFLFPLRSCSVRTPAAGMKPKIAEQKL